MRQDSSSTPILRVSYALLLIALAAGIFAFRYQIRFALLPAAAVFGWTQTGGL